MFANFTGLLGALLEIYEISKEQSRLRHKRKQLESKVDQGLPTRSLIKDHQEDNSNTVRYTKESLAKQEQQLKAQKFAQILIAIKSCGDSITSSQLLGWPKKFLGIEFNDGMVGCGGLTSACISCYQIYPVKNK